MNRKFNVRKCASSALFLLVCEIGVGGLTAQVAATSSGTVTDASGAAVSGATTAAPLR